VNNPDVQGTEGYVYVRVEINGESIGMLRLPNNDYVRFVRERLNYDPKSQPHTEPW